MKTTYFVNQQRLRLGGSCALTMWFPPWLSFSANLGTSTAMNYVASAIETEDTSIPMGGTVHTVQNWYYTPGNPWTGYCYNSKGINVAGSIGACDSSNFAWDITW